MASNVSVGIRTQGPSYQAYQILHFAFVVAPLCPHSIPIISGSRSPAITGRTAGLTVAPLTTARSSGAPPTSK